MTVVSYKNVRRPIIDPGDLPIMALFARGEQGAWLTPGVASYQDAGGTVQFDGVSQPYGLIRDRSGNGAHAAQPTVPARPVQPADMPFRLRSDFVDDALQIQADSGAWEAWVNTPHGHYKTVMAGTSRLPLNDATNIIIRDGMTPEQEASVAEYFGTERVAGVLLNATTTFALNTYAAANVPAASLTFVGANGVTATREMARNNTTHTFDVASEFGMTAPVAMIVPVNYSATYLMHRSNPMTGSIVDMSGFPNLTILYCNNTQITGSLPAVLPAGMTILYCNNTQITGSLPAVLPAGMSQLNCNSTQITGVPDGFTVGASLGSFQAVNAALDQPSVDRILAAFVAAGRDIGTRSLFIDGGANSPPSPAGLADRDILVSRGWTVRMNA